MRIARARLDEDDVRALLVLHQRRMFEASPPGTSFALDLAGLETSDITIVAARREDGSLLGVAALKELGGGAGEIKSMRTADNALRSGVAKALLDHLCATARERGMTILLLETGSGGEFAAAHRLYLAKGFQPRGPFASYSESDFNQFYEMSL